MKRLLQINVAAVGGATGTIVGQLARNARACGWDTWILYGRGEAPGPEENGIRVGCRLDQMGHGLLARIRDHHGEWSGISTRRAVRRIRQLAPDLVHLHILHGYYLNYPALFDCLDSIGVPVVWTLHDCWPFTGRCAYYSQLGCDRWTTGCGHCPSRGVYPTSLLDGTAASWSAKRAAFTRLRKLTCVPVSHWMESQLKQSFLSGCPSRVIYNGIDMQSMFPEEKTAAKAGFGWQNLRILLGVAMFWNERKGFRDYLALEKRLPPDCRIVMAGLDEAPAGSRIIPFPRTGNRDVLRRLYSAADVTLNLSYEESFGMTTPESLACGTPVIAYDRTASPELLDERVGRIVPAGNVDAVCEAVNVLLNAPCPGDRCRTYAAERFDLADRMKDYMRLYEELL